MRTNSCPQVLVQSNVAENKAEKENRNGVDQVQVGQHKEQGSQKIPYSLRIGVYSPRQEKSPEKQFLADGTNNADHNGSNYQPPRAKKEDVDS